MLWIDSVSRWRTRPNITASATEKRIVVVHKLTPKLSVRLSVMSVPTTLISTTADQYTTGT